MFTCIYLTNEKIELTTKLTLVVIGLTAGSALLVPATYASFHPVTTGEIADNTIRSADISNTAGVASVDIINGQVASVDIGTGQVASVDIRDGQVGSADIGTGQVASVDIQDGTITKDDIAPGSLPATVHIPQQARTVPPNEAAAAEAFCSPGSIITGGGFWIESSNMEVSYNAPIANSWAVTAHNPNAEEAEVVAYAICLNNIPA